ncbi:MAG: DUF2892 domain-containing protein [Gemmataceae bacterium]
MIPSTTERIPIQAPRYTPSDCHAPAPRIVPSDGSSATPVIDRRLAVLGHEPDVERLLCVAAAVLTCAGVALGVLVDPWFFLLSAAVAAFLLQHGLLGWCPPVELLRAFGFRTVAELDEERFALKALRGDFTAVSALGLTVEERARRALDAVRK